MTKLTVEQLNEYFKRIKYKGSIEPNLEVLKQLHENHVFNIPFEGLDIHLGRPIEINLEKIYQKLITQQRGGYCYEMNGLFFAVLNTLEFKVDLHLAEVAEPKQKLDSQIPRHAILIVTFEDNLYLVDVGFGRNGLIHPLSLNTEESQISYKTIYKIIYDENYKGYLYKVFYNETFHTEYGFKVLTQDPLRLDDLKEHSYYVSASVDSPFTNNIIITKPTKRGRISLINDCFKEFDGDSLIQKKQIFTFEAYFEILKQKFNIDLNPYTTCFIAPIAHTKPILNKLKTEAKLLNQKGLEILKQKKIAKTEDNFSVTYEELKL